MLGPLIAAAALVAAPAAAGAQETQRADTSTQDTTAMGRAQADTAGQDSTQWGHETTQDPAVQNPPGYRGMERPVNVFPPDSAADTARAGEVEDRVTGTYNDSTWQDTGAQQQNPPGYRGMERPAGLDTAGRSAGTDTSAAGRADREREVEQYRQRLGELGYKVEKMSKSEKKNWEKRSGKNKAGTSQSGQRAADTTRVGESTPRVPSDSARRLPAAGGDTTGQSGTSGASQSARDTSSTVREGRDTTADTTRFGENTQEEGAGTGR